MTEVIAPKIGEPVSEVEEISDDYYTQDIIIEAGVQPCVLFSFKLTFSIEL